MNMHEYIHIHIHIIYEYNMYLRIHIHAYSYKGGVPDWLKLDLISVDDWYPLAHAARRGEPTKQA